MDIGTFLAEHAYQLIVLGLAVFSFVWSLIKGHSVSTAVKNFEEVNNLKYTKVSDARKKSSQYAQSFTDYADDYVLNPASNELEKLETPKNIQEKIQSYVDSCLESTLEKFLPKNVVEDNTPVDYSQAVTDLSVFAEAMDIAEEYREKFHLPDDMSYKQIYEFIGTQATDLKSKLGQYQKNNENKEVKKNAQDSQAPSEPQV